MTINDEMKMSSQSRSKPRGNGVPSIDAVSSSDLQSHHEKTIYARPLNTDTSNRYPAGPVPSSANQDRNIFETAFPPAQPPRHTSLHHTDDHIFYKPKSNKNYNNGNHNGNNQHADPYNYRLLTNRKNNHHFESSYTPGLMFRSADSTQRALNELTQKRYEAMERRRAGILLLLLFCLALCVHYVTTMGDFANGFSGSIGGGGGDGDGSDHSHHHGDHTNDWFSSNQAVDGTVSKHDQSHHPNQQQTFSTSDGEGQAQEEQEDEREPEEEPIEPGYEYLEPLRYFADLKTPRRRTDSNYFFHIPRSGGQTMKDISGRCLGRTLASEVGVRDGHGQDPSLSIVRVNDASYVNVDTTSVDGLHRASTLGLAESKMADMITSSYFVEAGMLFDLGHKGRAFVLMRHPLERAVSMYYYRTRGENAILDSSVTIEDYAQGNGIENNWMTRFLTGKMEGELTKEHLEQAKEILSRKFLVGFLDDGQETVYRVMKYFGWSYDTDETRQMEQEDCINELLKDGTNVNPDGYEMPKKGMQSFALITWQTQFDIKLYDYAKELFDHQTKQWGSKERKKELKKRKKEGH